MRTKYIAILLAYAQLVYSVVYLPGTIPKSFKGGEE